MALQVTTARRLVRELKARGRLEVTDEALVNVFVGLAAAVDESPDNAALWRQLRECEQDVRGVGGSDPGAVQALLDELRGTEFATPRRVERPTHGPRIVRALRMLGFEALPWQEQVSDAVRI